MQAGGVGVCTFHAGGTLTCSPKPYIIPDANGFPGVSQGGGEDIAAPLQQATPARVPSQRVGKRALTPDTPAPATPLPPAKALRRPLQSPFADHPESNPAVDDSASEPPSSPGVSSPAWTEVSSPADAYNPLLPSSPKVFGSLSWSRASRSREGPHHVAGRRSLDNEAGHAGRSGTPGDADSRVPVSESSTVPREPAAASPGAAPNDGDVQGPEGLNSSIRSRLAARLGDRPSFTHRPNSSHRKDEDPVFLDEGAEQPSSLTPQVSFSGRESGIARGARTDEAAHAKSPVRESAAVLPLGSPRTPEHRRLHAVPEDSNVDWKIRSSLASPSGSAEVVSESGGSPRERFFGDASSPSQRPKFKIASAADDDGRQGKELGRDAETHKQAEGDVSKAPTVSKARQMAEAVARAVAEAKAPGASLSPSHSGHQPRQRVGNLKDSPQYALPPLPLPPPAAHHVNLSPMSSQT